VRRPIEASVLKQSERYETEIPAQAIDFAQQNRMFAICSNSARMCPHLWALMLQTKAVLLRCINKLTILDSNEVSVYKVGIAILSDLGRNRSLVQPDNGRSSDICGNSMLTYRRTSLLESTAQTLVNTVKFSDRNMQLGGAEPNDTEVYFSGIPFEKVFHVGSIGNDRTIIEHRCAEVLATSPLPLASTLQWIYCRTLAERETLFDLLGPDAATWSKKIIVSDDLLVFERKYTFVEYVGFNDEGLVFQLNPRVDQKTVSINVSATDSAGKQVVTFIHTEMKTRPEAPSIRWRVNASLPHGTYRVRIELEGHLAFSANVKHGAELV
jgi:hypothetical protein